MHAFQRVFWKESRSQWQVWAGLLAGILLIQGVLISADLLDRRSLNSSVVAGLFITAVVVGVCYAAASAAILISGEREDETDFLLRTFPIPRSALIGGKIAFSVSSLLALVAAGFASAALLSVSLSGGALRFPASDLGNLARSMGGALVWGLFFSLLVDRVMVALGLAITMEIVVVGIVGNFVVEAWQDPLYWVIVAGVLAVDLRLAARWVEGRPLLSDQATSGGFPWPWGSADAAAAPQSTRWRRLLRSFVASGSPEARATGSLLWRELRGAVPFMAIWGAAGFVLVDLAMRFRIGFPIHFFYLHLTPVLCGLMTVLGDQRRGTYRFLADHGVSPLRVWNVKIGTWLLVAVLMTAFFGWYDVAFAGRLANVGPGPIIDSAWPIFRGITSGVRTPAQRTFGEPAQAAYVWNLLLSLGLLLFAVGQWASFVCRQPVVASAVAIGLAVVSIAWHFAMVFADVPLALATWPLSVVLLLATAWQVSHWMLGRSSGRFRLKEALIVTLPLLGVLTAVHAWRIEAIPVVPIPTVEYSVGLSRVPWTLPVDRDGVRHTVLPTQVPVELRDPTFPLRAIDAPATLVYFDFRNPETAAILQQALVSRTRPHVLTQLVEMADLLVSKSRQNRERPAAAPEAAAPFPSGELPVTPPPTDPVLPRGAGDDVADAAVDVAQPRADRAGRKFDPATLPARWDGLRDLLSAAEYAAAGASDWDEWSRAVETRQSLFGSMRRWGRIEGQTAASLDAAIADLRKTRLCVSPIDMLHRRNLLWQRDIGEGMVPGQGAHRDIPLVFRLITSLTGERTRSIRLANFLAAANLKREIHRPADPDHIALVDDARVEAERRMLAGWVASTFLIPPSSYLDPMIHESWARVVDIQFQNQVAARAGTILCLLLQRHRLEHGEFPTDLTTAIEGLDPPMTPDEKLLHDPYSGAEYQYRPRGFPAPLLIPRGSGSVTNSPESVVWTGQPLLWSVGPGHSSIDRVAGPPLVFRASSRGRMVSGPIVSNDVSSPSGPADVWFLILPP
jgi:hypothetical protein